MHTYITTAHTLAHILNPRTNTHTHTYNCTLKHWINQKTHKQGFALHIHALALIRCTNWYQYSTHTHICISIAQYSTYNCVIIAYINQYNTNTHTHICTHSVINKAHIFVKSGKQNVSFKIIFRSHLYTYVMDMKTGTSDVIRHNGKT